MRQAETFYPQGHTLAGSPISHFATWKIAATLVRRHPGTFACLKNWAHNGDGVTAFTRDQEVRVFINARGAVNLFGPHGHVTLDPLAVVSESSRDFIQLLEALIGVESPEHTPHTNAESVGYLFVLEVLRQELYGKIRPRLVCAIDDGDEGSFLSPVPGLPSDVIPTLDGSYSASRYWGLEFDDSPNASIAFDLLLGKAWISGQEFNLLTEYQNVGRDMRALVSKLRKLPKQIG